MLFDLRGRGRRRTVQVIYLCLALLLGGGLVLFGIGSDAGQGGLADIFTDNTGDDGSSRIQKQVESAEERARRSPRDANAWALLAQAQYQHAGVGKGFNDKTNQFTKVGEERLRAADRAWQRHLTLAGDKPNADVARIMVNVYSAGTVAAPDKAVRAQEVVIDSIKEPGYGDFGRLAALAYAANQTRKAELARRRALEIAPKSAREGLRAELDQAKTGGAGAAAGTPAEPAAGQPAEPTG